MSLQLKRTSPLVVIPYLIKNIIFHFNHSNHLSIWLIVTPGFVLLRVLFRFLSSIGKPAIPTFNFNTVLQLVSWSSSKLFTWTKPITNAPLITETASVEIDIKKDPRFVNWVRKAPTKPKYIARSKKQTVNLAHQVFLNSAINRYKSFLTLLEPHQLVALYKSSYFKHSVYLPPVSSLRLFFEDIKARSYSDPTCLDSVIDQLTMQAVGRSFLNPQAIFLRIESPLLKPLPPNEALNLVQRKLDFYKLLD